MKVKQLFLVIAGLTLCLYACKKDDNTKVLILGKWNVVSDTSHAGVGYINHTVTYAGQPGDYFDFRNDGFIYIKEGAAFDTLDYKMVSNTRVLIPGFDAILNGEPQTSVISNFTSHSIYIAAPRVITPGGVFGRAVRLSR